MDMKDSLLIKELQKRNNMGIIENIMKVREKASPILGRISNFFLITQIMTFHIVTRYCRTWIG